MCGIVGYVGQKQAADILIDGLKRLEYRGYDSAGICELNGRLNLQKTKGRISELELRLGTQLCQGTIGIGHTRWATHGAPSDENAHPHLDCTGQIAVVHNGIIENFQSLRKWLEDKGHKFSSQTDTEVVSHLVEHYYQGDLITAVEKAIRQLEGSYAIAVISEEHPEQLVVARYDSPLVIGVGEGENFVASDIPAILEHTRKVYVLEDGEIASVYQDRVEVYRNQQLVEKGIFEVNWDAAQAQKEGYAHFMLKEIHEQPKAIRETLLGRLDEEGINLEDELPASLWQEVDKIQLVACGTANHACLYGKALLSEFLDVPVEAELASEYRYNRVRANARTLMIVVSQSGETADTLGAMRLAQKQGAKVVAITNVVGSTLSREADAVLYTHAGPEIAVASTKAYTTQLALLAILASYLREKLTERKDDTLLNSLLAIPEQIDSILAAHEYRIHQYAKGLVDATDMFFLGRGLDYASAMEGQLKLKEISYIHGEALAGGELKHGTLALIEPKVPVVALATQHHILAKMLSNLEEVKARGGEILLISLAKNGDFKSECEEQLLLPQTHPLLTPLLTAIPLQLLAYYTALERGLDVDKPRNLAKSVTVE